MKQVFIKPLSVNDAWQGKRFKTIAYKIYEKELSNLLPKTIILPEPPYKLFIEFGFSSSGSDWDNPLKPFQDILGKKYKFNDNLVYEALIKKVVVPKGKEYIKFEISTLK